MFVRGVLWGAGAAARAAGKIPGCIADENKLATFSGWEYFRVS
jgi:hypothetical protein